jgi:hypothetical protein
MKEAGLEYFVKSSHLIRIQEREKRCLLGENGNENKYNKIDGSIRLGSLSKFDKRKIKNKIKSIRKSTRSWNKHKQRT